MNNCAYMAKSCKPLRVRNSKMHASLTSACNYDIKKATLAMRFVHRLDTQIFRYSGAGIRSQHAYYTHGWTQKFLMERVLIITPTQ